MSNKDVIIEWRVCWKTWRRDHRGEKVETVVTVNAVDKTQALSFLADNPIRNWIECREVTSWRRVELR
ncbi:MAG TPA: hypothetical protein VJ777_30210 [Mycobacterium sp.]|nr:hypothetical protein [Mycobacterium sp.]